MTTKSEKMRNYRERLKKNEHQYALYLQKDRERSKRKREKLKNLPSAEREKKMQILRAKSRIRTKQYRERIKNGQVKTSINDNNSSSASVNKQSKTAETTDPKVINVNQKWNASHFYLRDDVSQLAPGKDDIIQLMDLYTGNMNRCQKRYMNITIKEAYEYFKVVHPDIKISKSAFYGLRPQHVFLVSEIPHNIYNSFTITEYSS